MKNIIIPPTEEHYGQHREYDDEPYCLDCKESIEKNNQLNSQLNN